MVNRARCRLCHARLSPFYPAIEGLALVIAVWSLAVVPGWLAWATCGLGWALLSLALIDWRHLLLPDSLTLPLIPIGLLVAWSLGPEQLLSHVIGAAAGFLLLWAIALLYRRMRGREGLGLGDAKLLAAAGAWLGWEGLPSVILIAAATGLTAAVLQARTHGSLDTQRPLPFGPYLAGAFWLVWLYGPLGLG
jgi:leader peptidase (prepilin peptidase)/N-methyltransferase